MEKHSLVCEGEKVEVRRGKWRTAKVAGAVIAIFVAGWYFGMHQSVINAQTPTSTISPAALSAATASATGSTNSVPTITLSLGGDSQPSNADLTKFWRVWNLLQNNFVQAHASGTIPTDQKKIDGAIDGLIASYGDPYTTYFPPADATIFDQNVQGSFGGVGMEIGNDKDGNLVVIDALKGNPAEAAGIKTGDKVLTIDGTNSARMSSDEAVKLIRGPKGTPVKFTIGRAGEAAPLPVTIVRDTITIPNIDTSYNAGTGVFEIDLYSFSAASSDNFRDALRKYFDSGATRLLLDLRGNPGGYLEAAVNMASYFLPAGSPVVTEDYRGKQDNVVHRSLGYDVFNNKKLTMAILVDQGSASAAEILSGALQQHGVAVLVGTRTFGKGSVQQVFDLGDGAQAKITVARWLTPNGTSISDGGLTPNINATTTPEEHAAGKDPQKDAAIQWLTTH